MSRVYNGWKKNANSFTQRFFELIMGRLVKEKAKCVREMEEKIVWRLYTFDK